MVIELLTQTEVQIQREKFIARLRELADAGENARPEGWPVDISPERLREVAGELESEGNIEAARGEAHPDTAGGAYIPRIPLTCQLQYGLEEKFREKGWVKRPEHGLGLSSGHVLISDESLDVPGHDALGLMATIGGFLDDSDILYLAAGLAAVLGRTFTREVEFNEQPARPSPLGEDARVLLFGDWATGLPRARGLAETIAAEAVERGQGRRQHLIHLGDTYYAGQPAEYSKRFLPHWPKTQEAVATHWSLNGNHDMYSGGKGYFETLLASPRFHAHEAANAKPSSFFLLQNESWQIFGLDTAFHSPEVTGMNGVLDDAQADFVAREIDPEKGVILLTHHQLFSARKKQGQAEQVREALDARGVWKHVDAWIWGHEHRCVLYDPKWSKKRGGPPFAVCLGNGGVPTVWQAEEVEPDAIEWEYTESFISGTRYFNKFAFASLEFDAATPHLVKMKFFGEFGWQVKETSFQRKASTA